MDATLPSNPRRAGALWVAGTGAFLLLTAAAVFVAVSWDQLPDGLKLAIIVGLTGGFLVGGRAAERTLPATGSVLFHLGAFLLPVDVAAVAVRVDLGWRGLLLAEGLLGVVAWAALAHLSSSVVLRRAAALSVPVAVAGLASLTAAPSPLVLAVAAVAAAALGHRAVAALWATIAGLAPLVGTTVSSFLAVEGIRGAGVLAELGLAGQTAGLLAACTGVLAAGVLLNEAHRSRDLTFVIPAVASFATSGATTWHAAEVSGRSTLLAMPMLFLLLELGGLAMARDPFWARPVRNVLIGVEVVAGLVFLPLAAGFLLIAPIAETGFMGAVPLLDTDAPAALSLAVLALAWLVMGARDAAGRGGEGREAVGAVADLAALVRCATDHVLGAPLAVIAAVVAVEVLSADGEVTAMALVAGAGALAWSRRAPGLAVVVPMVLWAPATSWDTPGLALLLGIGGGAVAARASVTSSRRGGTPVGQVALSVVGAAAVLVGAGFAAEDLRPVPALAVAIGAIWVVGLLSDEASFAAGTGARVVMLGPALFAAASIDVYEPGGPLAVPAALAMLLLVADAVRLDRPVVAHGAAVAGVVAVVLAGFDLDLALDQTGLMLCLTATVTAGLAVLVSERWRAPLISATGAAVASGTLLAASEPRSLMTALVVIGGLVVAVGLAEDELAVAHVGGAIAAGGVIGHLLLAGVEASEAYLAPVCAHLLVAGWHARQGRPISSWTAYAPAVGLFGFAAVAERAAGGGMGHALAAAAVGAVAVGVGGWRRLAGPLFTGTAVLVAVTGVDVIASIGEVPAWIWLAVSGSALLGVGVALERTDTSPVDAGRRVVEVIADRFD